MRVEYVNPFVESALSVLSDTLSTKVEKGKLYLKSSSIEIMGVASIVGLAGDVEGRIILDMTEQTAIAVASRMLESMGMDPITTFDDLAKSSLSELANIITGQAVTRLSELGYVFDLTPPALFSGTSMVVTDDNMEALIVPIIIENIGEIEINVGIRERV